MSWWHYRSRVPHISDIALVVYKQYNYCAGPRLVIILLSLLQESLLGCLETLFNCLYRVLWETVLQTNNFVELLFQKIGTRSPSMPIVDSEEWNLGPCIDVFGVRALHVDDNGDSILVVVPDISGVSVSGKWFNNTEFWVCCLWSFQNFLVYHPIA